MGVDGGDDQGPVGDLPPGGMTIHRADGKTWGRRRVVVPLGSVGNVSRGAPPHRGVHQETTGNNIVKGGLLPHI